MTSIPGSPGFHNTPSIGVGGITAVSVEDGAPKRLIIGQPGCTVEIAGDLIVGGSNCAMCKADAPLGVLLTGKATRMLFCFECAKKHLHGTVKELVESLDVKDELEKTT
jgi:hypothetical protein